MDIPNILRFMLPNAIWSVGEDYDSLNWPEQADPKPSLEDIQNAEPGYFKQLTITEYGIAIQSFIDATAKQKNYDSALNCVSYLSCTVDSWKAEAASFSAWRDSVWAYCYTELPKFESGERPLIPVQEFIDEFPPMVWPD